MNSSFQRLSSFRLPCSRPEIILVAMAVFMGTLLRVRHTENLAVEHFDEGVYAAGQWFYSPDGEPYPARHLYSPPLVPTTIEAFSLIPSASDVAPFLPSMLLGSLTVLAMWWVARSCFGMNAGLFAVFVMAFSDYHITYSRMGLTDVPVLFWMCVAVGMGIHGVHRSSIKLMVAAGVLTAIAWWTKYLGWLPLAIVTSGSIFWWVIAGRRALPVRQLFILLLTMNITAALLWSPWLWMLQDHGGYAAVQANHSGYSTGFASWQENMASHIMYHFHFDSWLGAVSIGLGLLAAGTRRWIELARSTWNPTAQQMTEDGRPRFPAPALLARFVLAGIIMAVVATGISCIGLLTCVGIGGLSGIFLWPTVSDLHTRSQTSNLSPQIEGGYEYRDADMRAAAQVDPMLAACVVVAWFLGMVLTTPLYQPFPRLSLPMLGAIWIASAAGVAWWIEATVNVARRAEVVKESAKTRFMKRSVSGMAFGALLITVMSSGGLDSPRIWQDRTSLQNASYHLAQVVLEDARINYAEQPAEPKSSIVDQIISPDSGNDDGEEISTAERLSALIAPQFNEQLPLADATNPSCVVFAFGEPAVLLHLNRAGLAAGPVANIPQTAKSFQGQTYPTYFVMGPNALRTPGFMNSWAAAQHRFRHIKDVHFAPSEVTLLNLFTPQWVSQHVESRVQKLEVYRLR